MIAGVESFRARMIRIEILFCEKYWMNQDKSVDSLIREDWT